MAEKELDAFENALDTMVVKAVESAKPTIDYMSMLNEDQTSILRTFLFWLNNPNDISRMLITGYAGTGKTFLVAAIASEAKKQGMKVCLTAPTVKACRVLREKIKDFVPDGNFDCRTLHSLLRFKERISDTGEITFEPDMFTPKEVPDVGSYDLIINDEASMDQQQLYDVLISKSYISKTKIIFTGDVAQLPPVKEEISPVFRKEVQVRDHIKVNNLSTIVRQAETNPIIQLSIRIRNQEINENNFRYFVQTTWNSETKEGIMMVDPATLPINELIPLLFGPNFDKDTNFSKVLAGTNKTVEYWNDEIRNFKYGEHASEPFVVGEKLIADDVIHIPNPSSPKELTMAFNTNDDLIVKSVSVELRTVVDTEVKVYVLVVEQEWVEDPKPVEIMCLHPESLAIYQFRQENIKAHAMSVRADASNPNAKKEAQAVWSNYHNFRKRFASVKYNYAITVHKSQGSTFENTLFILDDVRKFRSEKQQLMYVACTRSNKRLFIY